MNDLETFGRSVSSFVAAIIGLAIIAVVLSNGAQTVNVIKTFFAGLTGLLGVIISPVTGGSGGATGQAASVLQPVTNTPTGVTTQAGANGILNGINQGLSGLTSIGKTLTSLPSTPSVPSIGSTSNFDTLGGIWNSGGDAF